MNQHTHRYDRCLGHGDIWIPLQETKEVGHCQATEGITASKPLACCDHSERNEIFSAYMGEKRHNTCSATGQAEVRCDFTEV